MRRLKEDVAWRMALAWQTPLQERVRLVSSFTSPRLCKSYDWVALNVDKYASLEHQLDQVHTFKAACTVWFALSCCRGYSGKENPGFWKRVFGKLREPRCPSTERERPSSMFHDEYRHPVTDAMRFFDVEEGREFPCVQLFTEAFDGRLRGRESVLIHAFFYGPEVKTTVMDVVDRQLHALLELFAPYIQTSRAQRIVPVSIRTSRGSLSESAMVELLPKLPTEIPTIIRSTREPVFVVRDLSYGQSYTEDEGQLGTMRALFQQYAVEISAFNWVTYASNDHLKPAPYLQLLLATDASVRARVLHWFHNLNTSSTKGLAALCSGISRARSVERLTLRGGNLSSETSTWAWIGYALFHPDTAASSWTSLDLLEHAITLENVGVLKAMAKGNNLFEILSDSSGQNTTYSSADLRKGAIVRMEPSPNADELLKTTETITVDATPGLNVDPNASPEWVCVVLPTYGLGWTLSTNIRSLTARPPSKSHLKSLVLDSKKTSVDALLGLLSVIGTNLQVLDLGSTYELDVRTVEQVLRLCSRLKSLRVCHNGSYWAQTSKLPLDYPVLEELSLRLPRDPHFDITDGQNPRFESIEEGRAHWEQRFTPYPLAIFVPPSMTTIRTLLCHLTSLCIEANVQGEFEQSQSAIQHTLRSLPRLDYFYFKLNRTASGKQNEPLTYTEGKMQSSVCLGLSVREISRVVLCDEYVLPFLSVCRHNLMQHSPMRQLNQDVVNLIMAFVTCGPQGIWIENEGRDVVWRASNRPFTVY